MAREDDLAFEEYLNKMASSLPEDAPTKSKKPETYWSDMPTKVGMGILSLGRMGVNAAVGNDNKVYDFLTSEIERGKRELSPEQRRQDAEVAATLADDNKGALDVVGSMISNPRASAGMIAESLPSMFAGGGVGGILARGAGAVLGTVGRAGTLAAAGLGEGTIMAADVFDKTGSGEAALKALALGTVTGFIPGNVEATLTRKFAGEAVEGISDVVVPGMAKAGFVGATKRAAGAIGAESGQEFLQEGGQALIEQEAGGGPLNLHSAMKQGVAGAVVGGVMGGGFHMVGGEGSKAAELADAEQVLAQNPTNPVAQAEVSLLRAQLAYVNAAPGERPELKTAIDVAKAAVLAARMPDSRAAEENLVTARGEAVLDAGGMEGARVAADAVSTETQRAIAESQSVDEMIQSFGDGSQNHSTATTVARSIQNVRDGVALAGTQLADDTYDANEEAQKQAEKEIEQADKERAKQQQEAVKAATQAAKLEQAKLKLQQEREKLGLASLPTINADFDIGAGAGEATAQNPRDAYIAEYDERRADNIAAMPVEAVQAILGGEGLSQVTRDYMNWTLSNRSQAPADTEIIGARRTQSTVAEAERRFRTIAQQNGETDTRTEESIAGYRRDAMSEPVSTIERDIQSLEDANMHTHAELLRALLDERENAQQQPAATEPAPVPGSTIGIRNMRLRVEAARRHFISALEAEGQSNADANRNADSLLVSNNLEAIAQDTRNDFEAAEYAQAILDRRAATGGSAQPAPAPAQDAVPAARPRDEIVRDYEAALDDWADNMNATLTVARRHVEALSDARVMEGLADPDIAPFMLPVAEYRGLAIPTNLQIAPPVTNPVTREVTLDFGERAMNALHNGVLDKLGEFWTKVMQGRGQRVFNINTRDLANVANGFRELTQDQLNTLMDRYNDELNRQAQRWAADHNQVITTLVNPIEAIRIGSDSILMKVRSLGRQGQNPYAVPQNDMAVGSASISKRDGHMTTTELAIAKGSSNLAYRLAAEIGRMAGHNIPAASSLLTNNRMRRHMQSVYADSLFGPGHLSPMESGGYESYQGVPRDVWEAARTDNQRIGLNILRAAHQGTENRHGGIVPISRFIENLSYNSRGEIVATSDPKHRRGWPKGTVVTEAMLTQRLLEKDMDFNFNSSYDSTTYDPGNRSNTGETAMGRSGAGGVGADTAKFMIMTNTILNRIENDPSATIPRAWETRAKKIGREMGGWMFSEAEQSGAKGISADDAIARVVDMVGNNAAKVLLESGMIDFVQTGAELTGETFSDSNGKVQGATTPDGKIILVLNNLTDKTFDGVLAHEAIHATLKNLLGDSTYSTLMSRLDTMLKAGEGSKWVEEANARVPTKTNPQDRLEEIAGYAVELHARGGVRGNPLVQWAKDFMSALRTAIIKNDSMPKWLKDWAVDNVQAADLTRMAIAGLKRAAKTDADLKPNLKATSINVGLTVGMGETAEVLTPEFVRAEIEKLGVKVGRSNVVDASYEHQGEIVQENTFVAELDRALTPAEVERLAINTKQQAIPQRVNGIGGLYGPKASEWGGFSAHEFRELNGQRSDAENRESRWRDWDAEIKALMEEHRDPKTTNARRSKINEELRSARMFQRADREVRYQNATGQLFSVGASYGTPREGAVSVVGVHFGNTSRNVLNSVAYGKGIKGEEAARLQGQNDIRPRTMFYVDEGNGIIKEPGLGNVGKQVRLNNLYDLREDALNLGSNDLNKMERAIVAAGFDGYYRPNYRDMGQGTVVVVGKHDIPVEPYVPGEGAAPAPAYTGNQYAEALAKSKLPGGSMLGREWLVALRNSEFDTPPVRAALEQRQDQRIYRDDLPGFNRGLRFSMSEEHAAVEPPVSDALPNELNILDLGRRPGTERMLEKTRAAIQDKHVTLRRIQQLAKVVSEMVGIDTIGALERMSSKLMAEQRRLVDAPLAKIENILNTAGYAAEEARTSLDKLLIARHAPEYNEHTATINPAKYDSNGKYLGGHDAEHPGSGVTDQQAAETVRLLTSGESAKTKALLEAEGVYRQMIADLQSFAVDRGLETQQTIDNWNKKFPYYAPFNRELNLEENFSVGSMSGSAGLSLRSGIARRAMGSAADIISPLASTTLWGLKTTQRGENAVVARTFLAFANFVTPNYITANGEKKAMWVTEKVPTQRVIKRLKVYRVTKADGTMSPEFYNLEKARAYADMQQAMWEQQNSDADPETSGIEAQVQYDGEPQNRVVIQPTPNYLNQPNVMVIPVEGENVIITFDEKSNDAMAILNAFKNKAGSGEAAQTLNKMLTIPRMFSRWVMATATGYNPVFMVFNAARDIQAAALNAGADKIPGWTAKDSAHIATGWMGAAKEILVQLEHEFKQLHDNNYTAPTPAPNSMGEWVDRMVAAGGATGITHSIVDVESAETQMRRLFGQGLLNKAKPIGSPNDLITNFNEGVAKVGDAFYRFGQGETKLKFMSALSKHVVARTARLNEAAELTTRALVFKRATELYVQAGHDVETAEKLAANISKNISTNFNRRGNWTNILNQVFPFFNAAANGTARLAETLFEKGTYEKKVGDHIVTDQKTKLTPYGKKVAGALASIGVLQAALLLAAGFDDDDIPENVKERAFIIPIPFSTDRDYFAIPMPHGFNLLVNAGRNLTDATVHLATGEYGKAAKSIGAGTFGQLGALNPTGSAGNVVTDMLPAIADPIVSLYMNKDAFGRPIAKEDLNPANPTPGFTRAKEGASKTARMLSEGLNTLTGGNDDQKGAFSPTPDQIDFVLGQVGGGVGRELTKAGSALKAGYDMAAGNEREPMPSYKTPLIGRLYGNADEPSSLRSKLFTVRTELNETYARYKGLKERGDREGAAAFKAEHPEISLRDDIERYARGNSKQTKARALARDQDEIGKVNEIINKQDSKVADLLRKYNELK